MRRLVLTALLIAGISSVIVSDAAAAAMKISNLGVSMPIPSGWTLDNPGMCHQGENTGMLMDEPLNGQSLEIVAKQMSEEFGSKIISQSKIKIAGLKAIKAHIKAPGGSHALRVYIQKGARVIWVSFAFASEKAYTQNEASVMKAVNAIKTK